MIAQEVSPVGTVIEVEAVIDLGLVAVLIVAWLATRFSISRKDNR